MNQIVLHNHCSLFVTLVILALIINVYPMTTFSGCQQSQNYYIAKYGSDDQPMCGNITNPCGTLYFVSSCIQNSLNSEFVIIVMDGQNKSDINQYHQLQNTDNYDPCLPIPFDGEKQITIQFITEQIMDDLFPKDICDLDNNIYLNEYIFDGGNVLNIIYWNVNSYTSHTNSSYGLIRNFDNLNASVICNSCVFSNISWMNQNVKSLFYISSSFYLRNVTFSNIISSMDIIQQSTLQYDVSFPHIVFYETLFINIVSEEAFLQVYGIVTLSIFDCIFTDISTGSSIISDGSTYSDITIKDSDIDVISGFIYISYHIFKSSININNIWITSNEIITTTTGINSLFKFNTNDIGNMYNINMKYIYDTNSCEMLLTRNMSSIDMNATCSIILCANPAAMIHNLGEVNINNLVLDVMLTSSTNNNVFSNAEHHFMSFSWYLQFENGAIIANEGNMNINNMLIRKLLSNTVIWNKNSLSVFNLTFDPAETINYNPNVLQSTNIIYQSGIDSVLFIHGSHFVGSYFQIDLYAGTAEIYDSIFENCSSAVMVESMNKFVMKNCKIINSGGFYGTCSFIENEINVDLENSTIALQITGSSNIIVNENMFSCYDPYGLILIKNATNVSLISNTFHINAQWLFYNISADRIGFQWFYGPVTIEYSVDTRIINNEFKDNSLKMEVSWPWIFYNENEGINCLYGNIFTYHAFHALFTNITSCLRPQLIEYISFQNITKHIYGYIDQSLFDAMHFGSFIVDIDEVIHRGYALPIVIFSMEYSNIALDNINITVINETNKNITSPIGISGSDGSILLIDSYITITENIIYDISYNYRSCNVIYNDRLDVNSAVISKLLINCGIYYRNASHTLSETMRSRNTNYVHHLSITKINLTANYDSYYPGQILNFAYKLMDIYDNIIEYNSPNQINIDITRQTFSLTLTIEQNECPICDSGVVLYDTSLKHNVGEQYNMSVSVEYNMLIPEQSTLSLTIIGCVVGYGATSNKYQCELCPFGTYNLLPNNTNECLPCTQNTTEILQCDGFYHINGFNYKTLYFLLLLLIPLFMICIIGIYCKQQYNKALVVNKALVLIIGISQFHDLKSFLGGVKQNVDDLIELWKEKYNYNVFVCNKDTLYSTKKDVINFIDKQKTKLEENSYDCVIIHIISHGNEDSFVCSNGKKIKMEFFYHELISSTEFGNNPNLIKLIFNHGCRGTADYRINDISSSEIKQRFDFNIVTAITGQNNETNISVSDASNLVIISGTVKGRVMSDSGKFTKCICESFGGNVERKIKADLNFLFTEIGNNLEKTTQHAEICNVNGTLRFNPVRFEKCKIKERTVVQHDTTQIEMPWMNNSGVVSTRYYLMEDND
eukprot:88365_1